MPDPLFLTLHADDGLSRLVRSLALSSRFRFYLAIVEAPDAGGSLARRLEHEVSAAREAPARVIRLDPYPPSMDRARPLPWRRLVDRVLAPLLEPPPDLAAPGTIVMVDASRAPAGDDEAWRVLFQRMNERRDAVAAGLAGALVLALPARLEAVFAEAAPDFWSVRSLALVL